MFNYNGNFHSNSRFYTLILIIFSALYITINNTLCDEFDDEFAIVTKKNDKYESINRSIFKFNQFIDRKLMIPASTAYSAYIPSHLRIGFYNFNNNITSPLDILISLSAKEGQSAVTSSWRFIINTTLGLFGLFDIASEFDIKKRNRNLGDLFLYYGMEDGNYIVLPFLGPSVGRTAFNMPFQVMLFSTIITDDKALTYSFLEDDTFANYIVNHDGPNYTATAAYILEIRSSLLKITNQFDQAPDPYIMYRDSYLQNLAFKNQKTKQEMNQKIYETSNHLPTTNEDYYDTTAEYTKNHIAIRLF